MHRPRTFAHHAPTPERLLVLYAVRAHPNASRAELARVTGRNPYTLAHHLRLLERSGHIVIERRGRELWHRATALAELRGVLS